MSPNARFFQFAAVFAGVFSMTSATVGCGGDGSDGSGCCKVCSTGKACGDSCIENTDTCHVGSGCACNASSAINAPSTATRIEPFIYTGPGGLQYESGELSGSLPAISKSIEIQAGQTASVFWEHIYLGALVPDNDGTLSFGKNFHSAECTELASNLVRTLTSLNGDSGNAASLTQLISMGFPNTDEFREIDDIRELAKHSSLLASFGAGLEYDGKCH